MSPAVVVYPVQYVDCRLTFTINQIQIQYTPPFLNKYQHQHFCPRIDLLEIILMIYIMSLITHHKYQYIEYNIYLVDFFLKKNDSSISKDMHLFWSEESTCVRARLMNILALLATYYFSCRSHHHHHTSLMCYVGSAMMWLNYLGVFQETSLTQNK